MRRLIPAALWCYHHDRSNSSGRYVEWGSLIYTVEDVNLDPLEAYTADLARRLNADYPLMEE